jgi:hypothetical protein
MSAYSPLIVSVHAPAAGRSIATSLDPDDVRLILTRLAQRKRREIRGILCPATQAVVRTEVARFMALLALLPAPPPSRPAKRPTAPVPDTAPAAEDAGHAPRPETAAAA